MYQYNDLSELKKKSQIKDFDGEYNKATKRIDKILSINTDCIPIFIAIVGSTSYGITTETSDLDCKMVYIQTIDSLLSDVSLGSTPYKYKKQIITNKGDSTVKEDISCYEIGRYLELLSNNNPNILELRHVDDMCILYKHPIWDYVNHLLDQEKILTKKCYYTFFNYADQQIQKATGLNKKINNSVDKVRKSPLDFCSFIFTRPPGFKLVSVYPESSKLDSMPLRDYLKMMELDQKLCGLKKINNARDLYAIYYDSISDNYFSRYKSEEEKYLNRINKSDKELMGLGYKGLIKENDDNSEISNDIKTSSIPKTEIQLGYVSYNKDGYITYCKDYREYWGEKGWMKLRNEERYNDNISGGQNYDGKNIAHCVRLLYMASEIAEGKGVIVRRSESHREELLNIKKGGVSYEDVMIKCESLKKGLKEKYNKSDLPETISMEIFSKILLKIRRRFYFDG